jgi:hypothetical protein
MKDNVDWNVIIGYVNGAEDLLGVIDIDIANKRETQESHRLLPVYEQNYPRIPLTLQLRDLAGTHDFQHALSQHGL